MVGKLRPGAPRGEKTEAWSPLGVGKLRHRAPRGGGTEAWTILKSHPHGFSGGYSRVVHQPPLPRSPWPAPLTLAVRALSFPKSDISVAKSSSSSASSPSMMAQLSGDVASLSRAAASITSLEYLYSNLGMQAVPSPSP